MNEEEIEKYMQLQQKEVESAKTQAMTSQMQMQQQAMDIQQMDKSLLKEQIDLSEELDTIEHLLRGHLLEKQEDGSRKWVEPKDKRLIILTDYGVYLIMNFINFYLNKNTLLSCYDEETINKKMYDLSNVLNDDVFMEYDIIFNYPSFEECKEVLMGRLDKKIELKKFAYSLIGKEVNESDIKKSFINEMEDRIDYEITKIKEQLMKNKLKRFESILRVVQDTIHSTYLRAYAGQERKTLRQHTHITETVGGTNNLEKKPSKLNPLNMIR